MGEAYLCRGGAGEKYSAWNDYSTVEHWTGKYLIDPVSGERQKIYARRIYATLRAGDNYIVHNIANLKNQVSLRAMLMDGTVIPKATSDVSYSIPYVIFRKAEIVLFCGASAISTSPMMMADAEYTCTDR
ncbi:MAG: hypothetical protein RSD27_11790 [Ruthenibacterium sp.]